MWVLLYKPVEGIYINSYTSSTPMDLYEIPHIFAKQIIHTHFLQTTQTGYYIYIYIYITCNDEISSLATAHS